MNKNELKNELVNLGISTDVINFAMSDENIDSFYGKESVELGDIITLVKLSESVSTSVVRDQKDGVEIEKPINWIDVITSTGAISLAKLVSTGKKQVIFDKNAKNVIWADNNNDIDFSKVLTLPRKKIDVLKSINQYFGKSYKVAAIANDCGKWKQTFYLFVEV